MENKTKAQLLRENEQLRHQLNKLKQGNKQAFQAERAQLMLETLPDVALLLSANGVIYYHNSATERTLGYQREELIGDSFFEYVHSNDMHAVRTLFYRAAHGLLDHLRIEFRFQHASGMWTRLEATGRPLQQGEHIEGLILSLRSLTQRRQLENLSRQQIDLLENVSDAVITTDLDFNVKSWNRAASRIYGWSAEAALGRNLRTLLETQHDRDSGEDVLRQLVQVGQWQGEVTQTRQDGSTIPVLSSISFLQNEQGELVGAVEINRDITAYKQAIGAIKESEERYRLISEMISDYVYVAGIDDKGNVHLDWITEAFTRITGYDPSEIFQGDIATTFEALVYPDDLGMAMRHLQALNTGQPQVAEFRIVTREGQVRWLRNHVRLLPATTNGFRQFVGSAQDITDREMVENTVRLLEAAVSASIDGITISDAQQPDYPIIYVNPAFEEITGYLTHEVLGRNYRFLQRDDSDQPALEELHAAINAGEQCQVVLRNYRKDGTLFWNEMTIYPLYGPDGTLTHFVGLQRDVSERRQLERRLDAIYQLGRELTLLHEQQAIVERVLHVASEVLQFEAASYGHVNRTADQLEYRQAIINNQLQTVSISLPLGEGRGLGLVVVQTGEAINVTDTAHESRYVAVAKQPTYRSFLGVPVLLSGEVVGVLCVQSLAPDRFTEDDERLLQALADQTAIALQNAHLYNETRRRTRELAALHNAGRAMASTLDLNDVLEQALAEVKTLLEAEGASVLLRDPDAPNELVFVAVNSPGEEEMLGTRIPATQGIAGQVIAQQQSILVQDAQLNPAFYNGVDEITGLTTSTLLAVPLIYQGQPIGVMETINKAQGNFTQRDLELFEALASSAAIAIKNARLYAAERLQYRRLQASQAQLTQTEKMAALGRLVASIAHEINNPLQSVASCLELVAETLEDSEQAQRLGVYMTIADKEIERISELVHHMRNFYHPNENVETLDGPEAIEDFYRDLLRHREAIDLHATLEGVLQLAKKELHNKQIVCEQQLADDLPPIEGNLNSIKQVFLNMVLNAIDAMSEAGGTLRVHTVLTQHPNSHYDIPIVRITFSDTGTGIPGEALERIFEPMFTTKERGSGFGLYTSYKIIEAHHGEIMVDSQIHFGTTFTIFLPLAQP